MCAFHREQAWLRWITGRHAYGHELEDSDQETLLKNLRNIANARTEEELDASLKALRDSTQYQNAHVSQWLERTWLSCIEVINEN